MANQEDLNAQLMTLGKTLGPIVGSVLCLIILVKLLITFRVYSGGNEWLLVIRSGKLLRSGIGISAWKLPQDQVVKFPSLIQQVNFSVVQVSQEMQGIQLSGMLIWNVMRSNDGPMNCFKFFGADLQKPTPVDANKQIEALAVAIFRDKIANLTIMDIMKNRHKLRGGVKEEMQKVLSGWGIWLETCEIMDVKITSKSLFVNLQTEFREDERMKAERIQENIQNKINEQNLARNSAYSKKEQESKNKLQHESLIRNTAFNKTRDETNNVLRHEQMQRDIEYKKKQAEQDQALMDLTLNNSTDYQKKSDDFSMETKKQAFERNTMFNELKAKTNHTLKQETLDRNRVYSKLQEDTNNQQYIDNLERDNGYQQKRTEIDTIQQNFQSDQSLKHTQHAAVIYKKQLQIDENQNKLNNDQSLNLSKLANDLNLKKLELNAGKNTFETNLQIEKEADVKNLNAVKFEGKKIDCVNYLSLDKMRFDQDQKLMKKEFEIKEKGYTPNVLKSMLLESAKSVYQNQYLRNISIVSMDGGENNSIGKAVAQYKAISESMETK